MESIPQDYYATLGLERGCTTAQIRAAYRSLAKRHHPDLHGDSAQMEALNAAHETLRDPARRRAYDQELSPNETSRPRSRIERNIAQDVTLRIEELLRGAHLDIRVRDPVHVSTEEYGLNIPAGTAPGARFRIPRDSGGVVNVRVRVAPHFRFKVRGSDLRCDLRIDARRATEGAHETIAGPLGNAIRVKVPPRIARGEVLRIAGEGLPKARGGRGDLLVRVTYRPEVRITRTRGS